MLTGNQLQALQARMVDQYYRIEKYLDDALFNQCWMPGEGCSFDAPRRHVWKDVRPVSVGLETTENAGLRLNIAVAHPHRGRLVFVTHGSWDFTAPIVRNGRGEQLDLCKAKHRLNAKRGLDLLSGILDFGFARKRGEDPQLPEQISWPTVDGKFEDYTPVLGATDRRVDVQDVTIQLTNPAAKILARHGIENVEKITQDLFSELAAEVRATAPDLELSEEAVCEALLNTDAPLLATVDIKTAIATMPSTAAAAIRRTASRRAAQEATDDELLKAAVTGEPVRLARLSRNQLNTVDQWYEQQPAAYFGSVLTPVSWTPDTKYAIFQAVEKYVEV